MSSLFVQAFVTLLVIFDPLAAIPVFLTLTRGQSQAAQRRTARVSVLVAAGIVTVFAVAGNRLLDALGISLQALQVAGGALLALIALDLLKADCARNRVDAASGAVAFVPLGTPLLAGPGAIAATMLYMEQAGDAAAVASVALALAAALLLTWLTLRFSPFIGRLLKDNGLNLVTRIMGLLAAAIAVQLVAGALQHWARWGVS
ncbi:NAAT family transporter [Nonomuraea sp. NN258]|uniref:MarC family protein n=1 Tax=Nonomuraea antri TaxID=2730852 RepID=UPI00156A5901|nr:MarC family protein [Nonomuraea antri]NRQ39908.1 NAAT family transporter [Nonomuraea antri]